MKKLIVFFVIIIIIVSSIYFIYLMNKTDYNISKMNNMEYLKYIDNEISGTDIATIINKAIDNNENNKIEKDIKGAYIENNINSIKIELKMKDIDEIYIMENIYKNGIQNFVMYYGNIYFKCIKVEYHTNTNKIKYMLFEQITQ